MTTATQSIARQLAKPLKHVEYAIRRADGSVEYGTTDDQGHTHLLSAVAKQERITIYIEG